MPIVNIQIGGDGSGTQARDARTEGTADRGREQASS